jgi:hypothetical protein
MTIYNNNLFNSSNINFRNYRDSHLTNNKTNKIIISNLILIKRNLKIENHYLFIIIIIIIITVTITIIIILSIIIKINISEEKQESL